MAGSYFRKWITSSDIVTKKRWRKCCMLLSKQFCVLPKGQYPESPHIILQRQCTGFDLRVVKEAIFLVLQRVYEPLLTNCHGFRPGRGFHTALQYLRHWTEVSYFIKITARHQLRSLPKVQVSEYIKHHIEDEELTKLLKDILNGGSIDFQWKTPVAHDGSIQGRGLSFLWSNIYLQQLDAFVKQELLRDLPSMDYRRVQYVRHAGNILVGYTLQDKKSCENIYKKISEFLEENLGLTVDSHRSGITHHSETMDYLGFGIVYKPVKSETFEGEVHLQRLKEACMTLKRTRIQHLRRIYGYYERAIAQAVGKTLRDALLRDRRKRKRWWGIQRDVTMIKGGLKNVLSQAHYKDVYYPDVKKTLVNELVVRAVPPEIVQASFVIDKSLKKFTTKVFRAERKAQTTQKVDPELIRNMSTGTVWFSCVDLVAPIEELKSLLEKARFFKRGRESHNTYLFRMTDEGIVLLYAHIALSLLKYYRCSNNLPKVRELVNYNLRYSCLLTITGKHQKTLPWTIERYTKDLLVKVKEDNVTVVKKPFPTREQVLSMKHGFFMRPSPTPPWELISRLLDLRRSIDRATSKNTSTGGAT